MMKAVFVCAAIVASSRCLALGASNADTIMELLDRATPVYARAHRVEVMRFALNEDSSGVARFLTTANWERAVIPLDAPYEQAVVHVMRAKSVHDAKELFDQRMLLHHGIQGFGAPSPNRHVVEFGYPRILMRFDDVLVDLRDFEGSLPESVKLSLMTEFESGVQEWRKQFFARDGAATDQEPPPDVSVVLEVRVLTYEKGSFRRRGPKDDKTVHTYDLMKCVALAPSEYKGRRFLLIIPESERPMQTETTETASVEISKSSLDGPYLDDPRYFAKHDASRVFKNKSRSEATEPKPDRGAPE